MACATVNCLSWVEGNGGWGPRESGQGAHQGTAREMPLFVVQKLTLEMASNTGKAAHPCFAHGPDCLSKAWSLSGSGFPHLLTQAVRDFHCYPG